MPITILPRPITLAWSDFSPVNALSNNEDAHIDPGYEIQNRPLRRVNNQFMLAETFELQQPRRATRGQLLSDRGCEAWRRGAAR